MAALVRSIWPTKPPPNSADHLPLLTPTKRSFDGSRSPTESRSSFASSRFSLSSGCLDELEVGLAQAGEAKSTTWNWSRQFGLVRSSALVVATVVLCLGGFTLYWMTKFWILRRAAYGHSVFAKPLIPNPTNIEHSVTPFQLSQRSQPINQQIQFELDNRFQSVLGLPPPTLGCLWGADEAAKYEPLQSQGPFLFALNLWNNEAVFPTLARTLFDLAEFLGPANTHISIFENGSTDNTTAAMAHFAAALTARGVGHTIVSDPRKTSWKKVDRIAQLSVYRNLALAPVNGTAPNGRSFEEVVFINDVFVCPRDALELLHQRKIQNAHATCAVDWRAQRPTFRKLGFNSVKMYDNWVARSISGDMLRSRLDVFSEMRDGVKEVFDQPGQEDSRKRWLAGQPVPVYSCWNGMIALPAAPFQHPVAGLPPAEFRSALNQPGECAASECKTIARDFWARGLNRWVLLPAVHVTYAQETYTHPQLVALAEEGARAPPADVPRLIDWSVLEAPKSVVCWAWARGFHVDLPWRRTRESPFR